MNSINMFSQTVVILTGKFYLTLNIQCEGNEVSYTECALDFPVKSARM